MTPSLVPGPASSLPTPNASWPAAPLGNRPTHSAPAQPADFASTFDAARQARASHSDAHDVRRAPTTARDTRNAQQLQPAPDRANAGTTTPDDPAQPTDRHAKAAAKPHAHDASTDADKNSNAKAGGDTGDSADTSAPAPGATIAASAITPPPSAQAGAAEAPHDSEPDLTDPALVSEQAAPSHATLRKLGATGSPDGEASDAPAGRHAVVTADDTKAPVTRAHGEAAKGQSDGGDHHAASTATHSGNTTASLQVAARLAAQLAATSAPAATPFGTSSADKTSHVDGLAAALGLNGALPATAVPPAAVTAGTGMVRVPIDHPQWPQAVAETLMANTGPDGGRVRLQLNPAHLGPVDIELDIDKDRAKVQIYAAQPVTRAALQQAIPQLSALLAGQGLQLDHADVSAGQSRHGERQDHDTGSAIPAIDPTGRTPDVAHARSFVARGLVDDFA
ncbi:MAG: flagellar hook-length control protein FliK [Nevskiaceae bacterium]|nr:MAG: flagellar hook-length control protein FliK [Nevskiaceae bacterium]TBR72194.1 MAG: flagellar hook-length control protein FliK [Nevskiaceae bacterium]